MGASVLTLELVSERDTWGDNDRVSAGSAVSQSRIAQHDALLIYPEAQEK
jgi:hypothetical protein